MHSLSRIIIASTFSFVIFCTKPIPFKEMPLGFSPDSVLTSSNGTRDLVVEKLGGVNLVFFGYTQCPDFCPTTLHKVQSAVKDDAGLQKSLRLLFISVDPTIDTPSVLKDYLAAYPYAHGLTGSKQEIQQMEKSFGAYSSVQGKTISHSLYLYLVNAKGRVIYLMRQDTPIAEIRNVLKQAEAL
jgi:protein SCO1